MVGIQTRRSRHKEMLRQDILDAARELFVTEGYENVSMRKIAERIDYSPTIIYHHFKDKADLLYCLIEETFTKLLSTLNTLRSQTPDSLECLKKSGVAFVNFGLAHPNHYKVAFLMPIRPASESEKARYLSPDALGIMTFSYLKTLVAACLRQGRFRAIDVDLTTQSLFATVHGLTAMLIVHPEFPWADQERLIDYALDAAISSYIQ